MIDGTDARRLADLLEPVCLVTFFADEPTAALTALGLRGYWDGYMAGRAGVLGAAPAEVVDAAFYSFGPGEVARHVPRVWSRTTPEDAVRARREGSAAALRRILAELAEAPEVGVAADLALRAALAADPAGRVLYAGHRRQPIPEDPVTRLWHAATTLREHRGDGHVAALVAHGVGRTEAHVLLAVDQGAAPRSFGRVHHLPPDYLDAVIEGLRERGLLDAHDAFTPAGRRLKDDVERLTDDLAVAPYRALGRADLTRLEDALAPLAARLRAAGSR